MYDTIIIHSWEVNTQNFKITRANGNIHYWNSARLYQLDETDTTFHISTSFPGTYGTDINGVVYTASILYTPLKNDGRLIKNNHCEHIVAGDIIFNVYGLLNFYIDYGNWTCDNDAVVTVQVTANPNTYKTYNVTIP